MDGLTDHHHSLLNGATEAVMAIELDKRRGKGKERQMTAGEVVNGRLKTLGEQVSSKQANITQLHKRCLLNSLVKHFSK